MTENPRPNADCDALREALIATVHEARNAHIWQPYEAKCSCGVVPPVVDRYHTVERHEDEAVADAVLAVLATRDTTPGDGGES